MAISKHEEKKQLSEDNERRDLEKNNFVFPPAYSRGKRKIQFPIGMDSLGNMYMQEMQRAGSTCAAFLTGKEDSGKYSFLENVINYLVMSYHPDDVELWIMDLKGTAQITNIIEHCPPHIKYLLVPKGETMIFAFLDRIEKEYKRRINFLNNVGRSEKYRHYGRWNNLLDVPQEVYFPSIFVIINEVSILSQAIEKLQGSRYMKDYKATLQNILTQSKSAGFHFIFANQRFTSGLSGFSSTAMEQIRVRMAMSATTSSEIWETLNISTKYLTERQISWIDDLSRNQMLLYTRLSPIDLEEIEKPSIEKVKIFDMLDEERALQYERFDWLNLNMVGGKKYDLDKIDHYVEKHPILYNGEQYTFDECKQNMMEFYRRYSQRIDFDPNDCILFTGYPLNLLPADPVIMRQGENENIAFFADENNYIESLSNTLFACLRSINPKRTKIEIWALQDDKKMKIFPEYWSRFKCVIGEENICKRVKELKEEMFNNSLSNTYILVFRPYMIEHRINRKIEFMKIKNQSSNTMVQGKSANQLLSGDLATKSTDHELNSELSLDGLSNILNISRQKKKNVSGRQGLYDIEEDLKVLCQFGSESGLHFAMIENSWNGFKETRLKIDWFKHIFSIGFPQGDSMNIPFGSVAGKTESDMIFYTDGIRYKLFLPYGYNEC
ncbi:MAG: FtsK/SpoIIIE domain-containing protein [Anaerobutyricum soehngenii]